MNASVRVRFAPSPTGHLHVGGARTALFNWLFARHHGGAFILRIEDTDRSRSTEENIGSIVEALQWLGLDWDEGPPMPGYRQTERLELYREHASKLLAAGGAYYCGCSTELLEVERKAAAARKETFRYSGRCRERGLSAGALRIRAPETGVVTVHDLINGLVSFDSRLLDDWILVRSDGIPTYNFSVVVDDVAMRISHVIRGKDHLSNTPKQIICYQALNYAVPVFAHVSMILGPDGSRLSKRHGATSVQEFQDAGYLADAMVNYLARLGWSHGDQEIFSRESLVNVFDITQVSASEAMFDQGKLDWLSQQHMKMTPDGRLADLAASFFREAGFEIHDREWLERVVGSLKERARTLRELVQMSRFYFRRPDAEMEPPEPGYEYKAAQKYFKTSEGAVRLKLLISRIEDLPEFCASSIEAMYRTLASELGIKLVDLAQLTRLAITGGTASPPLFQLMELLGRQETVERMKRALRVAAPAR